LLQVIENAVGFGLIQGADGEANMDDHVIADIRFGGVSEIDLSRFRRS
jgi:hypothetical protein